MYDLDGGAGRREIVKRPVGDADDVGGDERGAFRRRVVGALKTILPFVDGPALEIVLGELREDLGEVDLAVAQRTISRRALQPRPVSGIEPLPAGRPEFGVLDVKRLDPAW